MIGVYENWRDINESILHGKASLPLWYVASCLFWTDEYSNMWIQDSSESGYISFTLKWSKSPVFISKGNDCYITKYGEMVLQSIETNDGKKLSKNKIAEQVKAIVMKVIELDRWKAREENTIQDTWSTTGEKFASNW